MVGMLVGLSGPFALVFAALTTLVFLLPFIFVPATWCRLWRWSVPADWDALRYFVRCLGCLGLAFDGMGVYAALYRPSLLIAYIAPLAAFCAMMVVLHVYGWLKRQQPWTETAEIPMWIGLTVACLMVLPV